MIRDNGDNMRPDQTAEAVTQALRRIIRAVDLHSRLLVTRYGLTAPQLTVLKRLAQEGPQPIGRLAESVRLSQATITGIVDRLVKRDLVRRVRCQDDRRRVLVELTQEGTDVARQSPAPLQETFRRQFEQLADWERTLILSSLQRLVGMMEAQDLDATPILTTGPMTGSSEQMKSFLDQDVAQDRCSADLPAEDGSSLPGQRAPDPS